MIILDFYGLPGSGKSTLSHLYANYLRTLGFRVLEPSWNLDMKYSSSRRILQKLILSFLFFISHPNYYFKILKWFKFSGIKVITKIKLLINIMYTLYYENSNGKYDYIIMDEGIIQAVISLYTDNARKDFKKCYLELSNMTTYKINPIYIKTPIKNVKKNLHLRENGNSRVDRMEESDKKIMLNKIFNICENIEYKAYVIENNGAMDDALNKLKLLKINK